MPITALIIHVISITHACKISIRVLLMAVFMQLLGTRAWTVSYLSTNLLYKGNFNMDQEEKEIYK